MSRCVLVGVIGPSAVGDGALLEAARQVGRLVAEAGFGVLTGGTTGIMEAASEGASDAGGVSVGVVPSDDSDEANAHVRVVIAAGNGEGRNILIVNSSSALIVVGKSHGTLSEVALALRAGKLVVSLSSYGEEIDDAIVRAHTAEEAVSIVVERLRGAPRPR